MNTLPEYGPGKGDWICDACQVPLEQRKVQALYQDGAFDLSLPHCPQCGQYFVPKELAEGKMLEVERLMEDK